MKPWLSVREPWHGEAPTPEALPQAPWLELQVLVQGQGPPAGRFPRPAVRLGSTLPNEQGRTQVGALEGQALLRPLFCGHVADSVVAE